MPWPRVLNDDEIPEYVPEIVSPVADDPVNPDCVRPMQTYEGTVVSTPRPRKPETTTNG